MLLDFEPAQASAFPLVFGNLIKRQGCLFHYRQANLKRLRNDSELYEWLADNKDQNKANFFRVNAFVALVFLKPGDVQTGYDALVDTPWYRANRDKVSGFVQYYLRQ